MLTLSPWSTEPIDFDALRGMRILHLVHGYPREHGDNSAIFVRRQIEALRALGVHQTIVFPELQSLRNLGVREILRCRPWPVRERTASGLDLYRTSVFNIPGWDYRLYMHYAGKLVAQLVASGGSFDLIHAHNACWPGVAAHQLASAYGVPYIITEHDSRHLAGHYGKDEAPRFSDAYRAARRIIAVSPALARALRRFPIDPDRLLVIGNVVDEEFFTLSPHAPQGPFTALYVGSLKPGKNVEMLVRAFAAAFADCRETQLLIAGSGEERRSLGRLIADLGIADRTRFLGQLDPEGVRRAMGSSHVLVVPSQAETFSVVLIEALATGLPVIATRCGGPEFVLQDGGGWLVPVDDIPALRDALLAVSRKTEGRAERQARREIVIRRFSNRTFLSTIAAIYAEVVRQQADIPCTVGGARS